MKKAGQKYRTDAYGIVKLVRESSGGWFVTAGGSEPFYVAGPRLKERVTARKSRTTTEVIKTELTDE
jgi:hypothetical protein